MGRKVELALKQSKRKEYMRESREEFIASSFRAKNLQRKWMMMEVSLLLDTLEEEASLARDAWHRITE